MNVICLQCTENFAAAKIIKRINSRKDLLPQKPELVTEQKKILLHGEKSMVKRHFRRQLLKLGRGWSFVTVWLEEGTIVADSYILYQRDLYISYSSKALYKADKLVRYLLGVLPFVLVEPDAYERMKQAQTSFNPLALAAYKEKRIKNGLQCHMPWQLYAVNVAWQRFLAVPTDRAAIRQLRVKVRRLRSLLTFFKPALKQEEGLYWQSVLRAQGESIGHLRELDVALMGLERMQQSFPAEYDRAGYLTGYFTAERDKAIAAALQEYDLRRVTGELSQMYLWLQGQPIMQGYSQLALKKFLLRRLREWSDNIMLLTEQSLDFADMPAAHKVRIKVKRFRYVVMSMPELSAGTNNLLRKLKRLQDMLGFVHDDYVNGILTQQIDAHGNPELEYEIAMFTGWENAKVNSYIEMVGDLWEDFCDELKAWKK